MQTAEMTALNRKTVDRIYSLIRTRIREHTQKTSPFTGEIEADESYFGPRRVKGKRGRGAATRLSYLACTSATARYTPGLFLVPLRIRFGGSYEGTLISKAPPTPTAGEATMAWLILGTRSILVSIMVEMSLVEVATTSTILGICQA